MRSSHELNEMPTASSIPSIRYRASNNNITQAMTSSSESLWGSKCHSSSDLISRDLVELAKLVGTLRAERSADERSKTQGG